MIFFDRFGGSKVGCLWNPAREQSRNLKPFLGYATAPVGGEVSAALASERISTDQCQFQSTLVQLDKRAILEEIQRTGTGIVAKITQRA